MAPSKSTTSKNSPPGKTVSKAKRRGSTNKQNGSVDEVEKRIISKMADRLVFGITDVSQEEVLKFAGYKYPTAQRFHQAKKSLVAKGLVEYISATKSYRLTGAGVEQAPSSDGGMKREAPKSNEAFHEQLTGQFTASKAYDLLKMLSDGRPHDRSKVCQDLGYKYQTAPAFAKSVAELKTLGFLEGAGRGLFQLTDKAFPCGRSESAC